MMDAAQAVVGTSFAPEMLVPVSIGRTTVNLYPIVDMTMQVHKRAHAFQINKQLSCCKPLSSGSCSTLWELS